MNISKSKLLDGLFIIVLGITLLIMSQFDKLGVIRDYPFIALLIAYQIGRLVSYFGKNWEKKHS